MIALQITNLKSFMSTLFLGDAFDFFLLESASITMAVTYSIDGKWQKDFAPSEYEYIPWEEIKPTCFSLIKGKQTPLRMQFVLQLMPKHLKSILQAHDAIQFESVIKAFVLTIRYDGEKAVLVTGTAYQTFLADKTPEKLWDEALYKYLLKKEIPCEML